MKTGIKFRISCSDTILNYRLSQKLKLLGNNEFNHLTIILTPFGQFLQTISLYGQKANVLIK